MPELDLRRKKQCINCGRLLVNIGSVYWNAKNDLWVCADCYKGYMAYLEKRANLVQGGPQDLVEALDKGTGVQFKQMEVLDVNRGKEI